MIHDPCKRFKTLVILVLPLVNIPNLRYYDLVHREGLHE